MKEGSKVPRKGFIAKREVLPDPIYNNVVVTKLINNIMLDGKKGVAQKIVYDAFNIVAEKTGKDALEAFQEAMDNIMPVLDEKEWKFVRKDAKHWVLDGLLVTQENVTKRQ